MKEEFLWVEKYRPHKISDCVLPERLKKTFQEFVNNKEILNLLAYGPAGSGKTTAIKAMCDEIGSDYMFINGSQENGVDVLRTKITSYASSMSLAGGRKYIIIDEADAMTFQLQQGLRGAIEEFSRNCGFLMTCNFPNKIMEPIRSSRLLMVDFKLNKTEKARMAYEFYKKVDSILKQEKISYDYKVVEELIKKYFPDYRRTLNELQRYSAGGIIDEGILAQVGEISVTELMGHLKAKEFGKVRKWVGENADIDASSFYRSLYDNSSQYLKPEAVPQLILILAKYQYQEAFVADPELNRLAGLVEVMCDVEFK